MAQQSFIGRFIVDVVSKGLDKTKGQLDGLIKSVQTSGTAHVVADKAARDYFNTQSKGVIGTANSTKSFSKLASTIGSGNGGLVGAYATLAANVFAVTAAFNALQSAAQVEQIERGLIALGNRTGQTLTVFADGLKEITGNAISTEQALRSTAQVVSAGFSGAELERLGRVATDVSFALGRSMTDSMDRLTRGVIKLEPELLDELGIMTRLGDATSAYAAELGKSQNSLTRAERSQAFYNAVMAEGELKFGGLSEAAGNTKAFDQLGATFRDLTKDIFNFINIAALPLAQILNNKLFLTAGLVLFAGTLKNQLLPGLGDMAERSNKVAEAMNDMAREQAKGLAVLNPASRDLKEYNAAILAGTATYKDHQEALQDIKTERERLAGPTRPQNLRGKGFMSDMDIETESNLLKGYERDVRALMQTEALASAQNKASTAISAAGYGELGKALRLTSDATASYALSLPTVEKNGERTLKTTDRLRVGMFRLGTTAKVLGAAFLNFIPILGQIIAVGALVWEGFKAIANAMETTEQKAYKEELSDLKTILEGLNEKEEEYLKITRSKATAYQREIQSLQNLGNSMTELNNQMEEVIRTREAMANSLSNVDAERDRNTSFVQNRGAGDYSGIGQLNYDASSRVAALAYAEDLSILNRSLSAAERNSEEYDAFVELLGSRIPSVANRAHAALQELIETGVEGPEDFALAVMKTTEPFTELSATMTNLETAVKNADTAFATFTSGSIMSTQFDGTTRAVQDLNTALDESYTATMVAGQGISSYINLLSSIPANVSQYMNRGSQTILGNFNEADAVIQRLEALKEDQGGRLSQSEERELSVARMRRGIAVSMMGAVRQNLRSVEDTLEAAQEQERVSKRQLELEKARSSAVSEIYQNTVAGLSAQFAAEDRIRNLQLQSVAARERINQTLVNSQSLDPQERDRYTALLNTDNFRFGEIARLGEELAALNGVESERRTALEDQLRIYANQNTELAALRSKDQAATGALAAQTDLMLEQQLIQESTLTMAQRQAALEERRVNLTANILGNAIDLEKRIQSIRQMETQSARILAGRSTMISEELADIRLINRQERERVERQYEIDRARLNAENAITQAITTRVGISTEDLAAAREELELGQTRLDLRTHERNVALQQIDAQERLQILERVGVDTRKEGLQMQIDALDYLERNLSVTSELNSELREGSRIAAQIDRRRRGWVDSDESGLIEEIQAAQEAYRFAIEEANLKRTTIELEYALLDAQRQQTLLELSTRRAELATVEGINPVVLDQLDVTINRLAESAQLIVTARDSALRLVDVSQENARRQLELLSLRDRGVESIGQRLAEIQRLESARQEAARQAADRTLVDKLGPSISDAVIDSAEQSPIVEATQTITSSTQTLIDNITELVSVLREYIQSRGIVSTSVPQYAGGNSIAMAADLLRREEGFRSSAYWDVNAYRAGYGSDTLTAADGSVRAVTRETRGVTREDAERDLTRRITQEFEPRARRAIGDMWDRLPVEAQASLISLAYNYGSLDNLSSVVRAAQNGDVGRLADAIENLSANPDRRAREADLVRGARPISLGSAETISQTVVDATISAVPEIRTRLEDDLILPTLEKVQTDLDQSVQMMLETFTRSPSIKDAIVTYLEQAISFLDKANAVLNTGEFSMLNVFENMAEDLGPNGAIVPTIINGIQHITGAMSNLTAVLDNPKANFAQKFEAYASVAQSAFSTIQSVLKASSDARIDAIDREIAAEQARDGKSAESLAKIQSLERKKDAMARKSFETNKKIQMAQAIVATATAVAQALSATPFFPVNVGLAALAGAMGAAQLAIIAGTSYQSTSSASNAVNAAAAGTLSIGKRGDSVDLARNNPNAGGELGYLRGQQGYGSNASNYRLVGSAYGGPIPRGYGNAAYLVGEKGPEIISPDVPMNVRPANDNKPSSSVSATINIRALDAKDVENVLRDQRGNIIGMLREAANSSGESFMEDVDVAIYNRPSKVSRL